MADESAKRISAPTCHSGRARNNHHWYLTPHRGRRQRKRPRRRPGCLPLVDKARADWGCPVNCAEFISRLGPEAKATKTARGWEARCPAHADKTPSLSINEGADGRVLLHCFAGCSVEAITGALGLKKADLMPDRADRNGRPRIVATYDYADENGNELFQVVRFLPKDFRQRHKDATGKWVWNMEGTRRVLYRLPDVLKAKAAGHPVLLVEGEKDVEALVSRVFCATCNPDGAEKWLATYTDSLAGASVFVIPDNDGPGQRHAQLVARALHGRAASVRVVPLPPELNGRAVKDPFDFFAAGGMPAALSELLDAAPEWTPTAAPSVEVAVPVVVDGRADAADIRGKLVGILRQKDLTAAEQRRLISEAVVAALAARGRFYFHAELRDFDSAMFFDGERKRLERVRSHAFTAWLSEWLRVNRADSLFKFLAAAVETAALSSPQTRGILPESFWTARPGSVYLSNGDGQLVRISGQGFALADNGTDDVLFASGSTLAPWRLCESQDPFRVALFAGVNCLAPHGQDLLRLWFYSLPTCPRSKPPMCLSGEVGSGKTRTAKGIAEFYGLPFIASKVDGVASATVREG